MAKIEPKSENEAKLIDSEPMLKRGLRNRPRSSIGDDVRFSQTTKRAPRTIAVPNAPTMIGSSQPFSGASMSA